MQSLSITPRASRATSSTNSSNRRRNAAARLVCALAVALIAALVPALAQAAKPAERYHAHFSDSFSAQLCGIDVNVELVGTDNFFILDDGTFRDTYSIRGTITNPLNGTSVVLSSAGRASGPPPVIDEQAGTITFQPTIKGLAQKIQTAHGPVLLRDAGIIAFAATFDLASGELIAHETTVNKGPHPDADSDFKRFCDVISSAPT